MEESLIAARLLDALELRGRRIAAWAMRTLREAATASKTVGVVLVLVVAATATAVVYALFSEEERAVASHRVTP